MLKLCCLLAHAVRLSMAMGVWHSSSLAEIKVRWFVEYQYNCLSIQANRTHTKYQSIYTSSIFQTTILPKEVYFKSITALLPFCKMTPLFQQPYSVNLNKSNFTYKFVLKRAKKCNKSNFTTKNIVCSEPKKLLKPWKITRAVLGALMAFCMFGQ